MHSKTAVKGNEFTKKPSQQTTFYT